MVTFEKQEKGGYLWPGIVSASYFEAPGGGTGNPRNGAGIQNRKTVRKRCAGTTVISLFNVIYRLVRFIASDMKFVKIRRNQLFFNFFFPRYIWPSFGDNKIILNSSMSE